jgi:uncharacterized membrane protein YfcA
MTYSLIVTLVGVLVASLLRGFTGFGFGLAAVPLLSMALSPAKAVPLVVTLQVIVGLAGLRGAAQKCDWHAIGMLVPGLFIGIPIGLVILTALPPDPVRLAIGAIILASVAMIHRGARLPPTPSRLIGSAVGLVSGIVSGLASMGGPPVVVYLLAAGLTTERLRATTIVYFMLSGVTSFVPMAIRGLITPEILLWSVASVPVLFGGSAMGAWAFRRTTPRHHRMTALITLTVLGVMLIARALLAGA